MYDRLLAARERDEGVRRIRRVTWGAGLAGVVFSALIGVALAHHAEAGSGHGQQHSGEIVIPGQPPQPAKGSGQVTSGAS